MDARQQLIATFKNSTPYARPREPLPGRGLAAQQLEAALRRPPSFLECARIRRDLARARVRSWWASLVTCTRRIRGALGNAASCALEDAAEWTEDAESRVLDWLDDKRRGRRG